MSKTELGDSLKATQALQDEHRQHEHQAKVAYMQLTIAYLLFANTDIDSIDICSSISKLQTR